MKTKLLLIATLLFSALFSKAQPCFADPYFQGSLPGVYGTLPTGYLNQDYSGVLFVVTDTLNSFIPNAYYVTYSRIHSISTLPDGFTFTAGYNNGDNWTNNGTFPDWDPKVGCVIISASAQSVNAALGLYNDVEFPLLIKVDECVSDDLTQLPCYWTSTYNAYKTYNKTLRLSKTVGIAETNPNQFSVGNSYPNPASGEITIPFNAPKSETVVLKIYSQLGMLVYQTLMQSVMGKNQFTLNTTSLPAGIYSYRLSNGTQSINRKLVVE